MIEALNRSRVISLRVLNFDRLLIKSMFDFSHFTLPNTFTAIFMQEVS